MSAWTSSRWPRREPELPQLSEPLKQLGFGQHTVVPVDSHQPHRDEPLDHRVVVRAEHIADEFSGQAHGLALRPAFGERVLQTEDLGDVVPGFPAGDEVLDVGGGESAGQQRIDEFEPRQVAVVVITHATAFLRRRQQSPLLIRPHIARRGAGGASEVVDAVLGHRLALSRCGHFDLRWRRAFGAGAFGAGPLAQGAIRLVHRRPDRVAGVVCGRCSCT